MMYNEKKKSTFIVSQWNIFCSCRCRCYHSVRTILLPGPILDLQIPTDRLVQHLAHTHKLDAHISMTTGQLPDRVHPKGSETKYHVFNNQITDYVDIYHSEATTLIPKACTMKYTNKIRAHTVTTHIQPQNPEFLYNTFTILLIPTIQLQMR